MQMSYAEYLEHFERVRQQKAAASTSVPNSQVTIWIGFAKGLKVFPLIGLSIIAGHANEIFLLSISQTSGSASKTVYCGTVLLMQLCHCQS